MLTLILQATSKNGERFGTGQYSWIIIKEDGTAEYLLDTMTYASIHLDWAAYVLWFLCFHYTDKYFGAN